MFTGLEHPSIKTWASECAHLGEQTPIQKKKTDHGYYTTSETKPRSPTEFEKKGQSVEVALKDLIGEDEVSPQKIKEFIQKLEEESKDNLTPISSFVEENTDKILRLKGNKWEYVRICGLDGTEYMGLEFMKKSWEQYYLPSPTKMVVLGTLEAVGSVLQWVILVGQDGRVYAYEEEEIHEIAGSLRHLVEEEVVKGRSNEKGHLEQNEVVEEIRQRTKDYVNKSAPVFAGFFKKFVKSPQ